MVVVPLHCTMFSEHAFAVAGPSLECTSTVCLQVIDIACFQGETRDVFISKYLLLTICTVASWRSSH